MFHFTMLGASCVRHRDGAILSLDAQQPKRLALLAYLAAARPSGAHRRDVVIALLWPDLDEARARSALRQALHAIRKSLGTDAILSRGLETLELSRELFTCDLWDMQAAADAGDHEHVSALYQGDFLAGLHLSGSTEFEQWVERERVRLRDIATNSVWALAEGAAASRSGETVACVRRALGLAGLDECGLRRGMRLLADAGDRASALSVYERFVVELRRELEVDVDPVTRALATEIRENVAPVSHTDGSRPTRESSPHETSLPPLRTPVTTRAWPRFVTRRRTVLTATVAVAAFIAAARHTSAADAYADARRVEVVPFVNESSIRSLDTLAQRVTSDARVMLARLQGAVLAASPGTGGTLVQGSFRVDGDSITVRAEVVDVRSRSVVRTISSPTVPVWRAAESLATFNDRLATAVATALYPGWGNVLSEPPSYGAYRQFLTGMRDITREHHEDAVASFRRAFSEDSGFTAAGLLAAMELYQLRKFAAADSLASAIGRRRSTLRPLDEQLLQWISRSLRGDRLGARAAMQAVVLLAPSADLAWLQLAIDNVETGRPVEAIAALDRIDRTAEFGEGWTAYWATRIEALHLMREHTRELSVARAGLSRHPEMRVLAAYELRALAALGRVAEVNTRLGPLAAGLDTSAGSAESIIREVSQELAAHGNVAASQNLLRRLVASYTQPEGVVPIRINALSAARTYYLIDDNARSTAFYDSVYRERPRCLDCAGVLGVLAARRGDRAAAERYARVLASDDFTTRRYVFGRHFAWRARIANALGDRQSAAALLTTAFANGWEFDVMTHADPDLKTLRPDSIYREFAAAR